MTKAEKVVAFIERYLIVPEGELVGQKIKLEDFQRRFIFAIYDNKVSTRKAILTIARKNGKTVFISCILAVHIFGPLAIQNSRIISGAMSRDQASEVYNALSKMIMLSPELSEKAKIIPSQKTIIGLSKNVEYRAISAEAKTAHGKSPIIAVLDEVGQIRGPQSDFVDAIATSQGAYSEPLIIYISTQASKDSDLLSIEIDNEEKNKKDEVVCHVYCADKDCDLLDEKNWHKANPALGKFRSLDNVRAQAIEALQMPTKEAAFRNLVLNQRIEINSPFLPRAIWESCRGELKPLTKKTKAWFGLDLAAVRDLTALVGITEVDGAWEIHPTFWLPESGLSQKSKDDRVPYDVWVNQKNSLGQPLLVATAGAAVDYSMVAQALRQLFDLCDVQAVGFDAYNIHFLKPWLVSAGFTELEIQKFLPVRQGVKTMTPILRDAEILAIEKKLRHDGHAVMNMCCQNATVTSGPTEQRMLVKSKATGRIDGMVALMMAIGIRHEVFEAPPSEIHEQAFFDLNA